MIINKPELIFIFGYRDEDFIEVGVKATNGKFAGETSFLSYGEYVKDFIEFGNKLRGFPKEIGQVVEKEFGLTRREFFELKEKNIGKNTFHCRDGYVGLKFFCIDNTGHTAVDIILLEERYLEENRADARGNVSFELLFDPASLDRFVQEIVALGEGSEGEATLIGN